MTESDINDELQALVESFGTRVNDNKRKANLHSVSDDSLAAFYKGIAIGRERSTNELERLIKRCESRD